MQKNTEKQWFNNGVCVAFALSGNSLLIKKKKKKCETVFHDHG